MINEWTREKRRVNSLGECNSRHQKAGYWEEEGRDGGQEKTRYRTSERSRGREAHGVGEGKQRPRHKASAKLAQGQTCP